MGRRAVGRAVGPGRFVVGAAGCLALAVLAAWTALWRLGSQPAWVDEATYRAAGAAYVAGDLRPNPEHPPLGKLLVGAWELLLGRGLLEARLLMVLVSVATATALWWWCRPLVGRWWALLPAGAWLLLPHGSATPGRLDRLVQLDTVMVAFVVVGLAAAWRWHETGSTRAALASGVFLAAAVSTKLTALLFLPALGVLVAGRVRRSGLLAAALAAAASAGVVLLAVWLPFGGLGALHRMLEFQSAHNRAGHLVAVDGRLYEHAPVWLTFRHAWDSLGPFQSLALVGGTGLAVVVVRPRRLVVFLLVALAVPLGFFSLADVALPHYYVDWVWVPTLLTGLAVATLVRARGPRRVVAWLVGLVLALSVGQSAAWTLAASGAPITRVQPTIDAAGLGDGVTLLQGLSPDLDLLAHVRWPVGDAAYPGIRSVVVGSDPRAPLTEAVRAWAADPPPGVVVVRLGDLRVYLPPRPVVLAGDRLVLVPRGEADG